MIKLKDQEERRAWRSYSTAAMGAFLSNLMPLNVSHKLKDLNQGTDTLGDLAELFMPKPASLDKEAQAEAIAYADKKGKEVSTELLKSAAMFADEMLLLERARGICIPDSTDAAAHESSEDPAE